MQANDIVMVNVTGTNGTTRNQKTISRTFNGQGYLLDDQGKVVQTTEVLRNLPGADVAAPPVFPDAQFAAATAKLANPATRAEALAETKAIQLAYGKQISAWEAQQGGGNENLRIAKSVLDYCKEFHGFREDDGDWFVMKLENLDVTTVKLNDGRSMYTVAGTAVFG